MQVSPTDPNIWFVATGSSEASDGVYRTMDGGKTWEPMHTIQNSSDILASYAQWSGTHIQIRKILMHPSNHNILYAATTKGLYKCTNATALIPEWVLMNTGSTVEDQWFHDVDFKAGDPTVVMASGMRAFISTNSGTTWSLFGSNLLTELNTNTNGLGRVAIATTIANSSRVVMVMMKGDQLTRGYVYAYDHVLGSWDYLGRNAISLNSGYAQAYELSQTDERMFYSGFITIGKDRLTYSPQGSPGNGSTLARGVGNQQVHHDDNRHIGIHYLGNQEIMVIGNDGGVSYYSDVSVLNQSDNWHFSTDITTDLPVVAMYEIGDSEFDKNAYFYGSQDAGGNFTANQSGWTFGVYGDGFHAMGDRHNPNVFYLSESPNGSTMSQFTLRNDTFNQRSLAPSSHDSLYLYYEYHFDQSHFRDDVFYAGKALGKCEDPYATNVNWQILDDQAGYLYNDVEASPANEDVIYAFLRTDGGFPWSQKMIKVENINSSPLAPVVTDIPLPVDSWVQFALDENNEDDFWMVSSKHGPNRVNHYSNGVFRDMTFDLPVGVFPTNIVKQPGPDNIIYISTNDGVYWIDQYRANWTQICGIPRTISTDLEINNCAQKLRAATYGRGIWETGLVRSETTNIKTQVTGTAIEISRDPGIKVEIQPGAIAVVRHTVVMPEDGEIIVHRGGKLIIDGGTITSACGPWKGIELHGNRNEPTNHPDQGVVLIINGGKIEHARNAITTAKFDNYGGIDWNYTGGVIQVRNGTFHNNWRAIQYLTYRDPVNPLSNESYFREANFSYDDKINDLWINRAHFITMNNVSGIEFYGCSFENKSSKTSSTASGDGIFANGSHFLIDEICNASSAPIGYPPPCAAADRIPSEFIGLRTAIESYHVTNSIFVPAIKNTDFIDVWEGIRLEGANNAVVIRNKFELSQKDAGISKPYGLYLKSSTNFTVNNNRVDGNLDDDFGFIINTTYPEYNLIYRNEFNGLDLGVLMEGINASSSIKTEGLIGECNSFGYRRFTNVNGAAGVNCNNDFFIAPVGGTNPRIGTQWGDPNSNGQFGLPNNRFSSNCPSNSTNQNHFDGNPIHSIAYYISGTANDPNEPACSDPLVGQIPNSSSIGTQFIFNTHCAMPGSNTPALARILENDRDDYEELVDSIVGLYINSRSQTSHSAVTNMTIQDTASVRTLLQGHSPYIEDDLMVKLASHTDSNLHDLQSLILIQNQPISHSLSMEIQNLNPALWSEISTTVSVGKSLADSLFGIVFSKRRELVEKANHRINYYLHNSIEGLVNADSVLATLNILSKTFPSFANSLSGTLSEMTGKIELRGSADSTLIPFMNLAQAIKSNGYLDSSSTAQFTGIAAIESEYCSSFAQASLRASQGLTFDEFIGYPLISSNRILNSDNEPEGQQETFMFNVYPNPSSGIFVLELDFEEIAGEKLIQIFDMKGRVIEHSVFNFKGQQKVNLNLSHQKDGVYFIRVINGNKVVDKKIILQR